MEKTKRKTAACKFTKKGIHGPKKGQKEDVEKEVVHFITETREHSIPVPTTLWHRTS